MLESMLSDIFQVMMLFLGIHSLRLCQTNKRLCSMLNSKHKIWWDKGISPLKLINAIFSKAFHPSLLHTSIIHAPSIKMSYAEAITMCQQPPHVLIWLLNNFQIDNVNVYDIFRYACKHGCLLKAQLVCAKFHLTRRQIESHHQFAINKTMGRICFRGDIEMAQWFIDYFQITCHDITSDAFYIFRKACYGGNLPLLDWLVGAITKVGIDLHNNSSIYDIFKQVCEWSMWENHQIAVAQWMSTKLSFSCDYSKAFLNACLARKLKLVKHLVEIFDIPVAVAHDIYCKNTLAFSIHDWLFSRFSLWELGCLQ